MATLVISVSGSANDAVLDDAGYNDNNNQQNWGTPGGSPTAAGSGQGARFLNVTLAAADTVTATKVALKKQGAIWTTVNWRMAAINEDNTAVFSSGSPPGARAIVTASIAAESLNVNHADATYYDHPSTGALQTTLGAAVAAVVARAGWASGNALGIVNQSKQDASQQTGFARESYYCVDVGTGSEPIITITYTPGASGTLYTLTVTGATTPAGAIVRLPKRTLTGGTTPTAVLVRATSRPLAGASTPTGALARRVQRSLAGATTPAGVLVRRVGRSLAGAVAPTGAFAKLQGRPFAGATTPTGALARLTSRSLAGATTPAGALARRVLRALAGATTPAGAFSGLKLAVRSFAGGTTPAGALTRLTARSLAGATTPAGTLARLTARALAGATTPAGALARRTARAFAGATTPAGAFSGMKVAVRSFAGATTPVGALVRQIARILTGGVTPTGALTMVPPPPTGGAIRGRRTLHALGTRAGSRRTAA